MSVKENAKNHILNIVELLINIIILGLSADRYCVDCIHRNRSQFADATIFGYFIVNCIVVANIFFEKDFHKYWRYAVAALGAVMFLITGILILAYMSDYGFDRYGSSYVGCLTSAAVLCLIMTILYIVDIVLIYKKEDE